MVVMGTASECVNTPLRPVHTKCHNVTLTGGTFVLSDRHCDGQNGLHTHLPVNVAFFTLAVTLTLGVNRPLGFVYI